MLTPQKKNNIIKKFAQSEGDTGSAEVQVAIFSKEIEDLTKHLKKHKKDNGSRMGLLKMVSKRRRLLEFLKKEDEKRYKLVIGKLGLKR